jgi:Pvc16 N-terminal domain/Carboxypeptidase regulatory-like domain
MFQDLDATLKTLLDDAAAPPDLRGAEVSFETPDKDFKPTQPTVNLFLYEVQENRSLRDNARLTERVGDHYTSRPPPLRVDCTYLATTWSPKTAGLKAEEEHRLLGQALLWLNQFPVIADGLLQGSLKNPPQPYPLPTMVAQVREDQSMGQFWSALGVAPRPAFSLTVTIAMRPLDQADQYPVVQAIQVAPTSLIHPTLAGQVLDHTLAPVASATVSVVETGAVQTVGPDGHFSFASLAFGQYTLRVQVPAQPDVETPVHYGADSQVHNVLLPGP